MDEGKSTKLSSKKFVECCFSKKSKEDLQVFLAEIFTERELNDAVRRYEVVRLLDGGKTYLEIQQELKMSPITISRLIGKLGLSEKTVKKAKKKPALKYKGATPIHRMF